jgi:hypothetical protein
MLLNNILKAHFFIDETIQVPFVNIKIREKARKNVNMSG